jgi:RND family efflux transporter MFP subunit
MDCERHEDEVIDTDEISAHEPIIEPEDDRSGPPVGKVRRRSRSGTVLLSLAGLLVVAGPVGFGAWRHTEQQQAVLTTAEQHRDLVPNLRVAAVKANDGTVVVSLPATTAAFSKADIFARASGYIDKRAVDIGDRVKEGQLLVQITAPELDQQIAQAQATLTQLQAALQQAEANRDLAQVTWNRDAPLVKQGWVTQQQGSVDVQTLKAQQAAVDVAQANVKAQQAQVKVLDQQKTYQRVVAPFDGVITQRNVDVGTLVQADAVTSTFMFTIMQSNVIRTQVFVPQDQAFGLKPGVTAEVRVPEIPGRTFPGTVTRIADALQPGTRTLLTEVDIPNPDGTLTPGMYCTIELHIPRKTPSLILPADAIIFNANGLHAAVVEDGVVHMRKITVARDLGTTVEVSNGLADGDRVVLNPPVDLADGGKVDVRGGTVAQRN